jgi:hypothetical protein
LRVLPSATTSTAAREEEEDEEEDEELEEEEEEEAGGALGAARPRFFGKRLTSHSVFSSKVANTGAARGCGTGAGGCTPQPLHSQV